MKNRRLCWVLLLVSLWDSAANAQTATAPSSEYKQYKTMADYSFEQGDYLKAQRLYEACLTMPKQDQNAEVKQQIVACVAIETAFKNLQEVLQNNPKELKTALQAVVMARSLYRKPAYLQQQAFKIIETEADQWLKNGKLEEAAECYLAIYELEPLPSVALKMEQTNRKYTEKFNRPLPQYQAFQSKQKPGSIKPLIAKTLTNQEEYELYRNDANANFQNGKYDLARRKYNAALQVSGFENDRYAQNQLLKSAKLLRLQKAAETAQTPAAALLNAREALLQNPNDANLKINLAQLAQQAGDELLKAGFYADAKKRYQEAAQHGASNLTSKMAEADQKIAEKRAEVNKKRAEALGQVQKKSQRETRREKSQLVGAALTAESYYDMPVLNNGNDKVNTTPKLNFAGGAQFIFLPTKMLSSTVGINFLLVRIATTNAVKTAQIESFDFNLLQVPVGVRFSKSLGNSDFELQMHGGITFNLPRNIKYTNYLVDVTTTDANVLSPQTMGFYGGIGLSKHLSKRRSVSLMLNYQRTNNLLNSDFKDNAINRSRASLLLQGVGIQLIFRVF